MLTLMILLSAFTFQPCATEDSTMCYWDSAQHGNGQGTSFYSISETNVILFK